MSNLKLKICIEVLEKTLIEKNCVGTDEGVQEIKETIQELKGFWGVE